MERPNLAQRINSAKLNVADIRATLKTGIEAVPNPPQGKGPSHGRREPPAVEEQDTQAVDFFLHPHQLQEGMAESSQPRLEFGGHCNYDFGSDHRSSSPKKRKKAERMPTSASQSFVNLSEEKHHNLAFDAMGSLYRAGDKSHFEQANKEEKYRAMQLAWAEFSIRAAAFAKNGVAVQSLITERNENREVVRGLRQEVKDLKDELEKLLADHHLEKEDWEKRRRRYKKNGKEAKAALAEVKAELQETSQKLKDVEAQLQTSHFEMAQAWLATNEGEKYIANECLEASKIGENESLDRMKTALSLMWPDFDFEPTFEKYSLLRDEELAQIMSKGACITDDQPQSENLHESGAYDQEASSSHHQ